jgi:hypothetical protein
VANVHFGDEKHDYGYSKRFHAYGFLAQHLKLSLDRVLQANGSIGENFVVLQNYEDLLVFNEQHARPSHAQSGDDTELKWP